MNVLDKPNVFTDGYTLDYKAYNENINHIRKALDYVYEKRRYTHSVISMPFHRDTTTPYTQADGAATLRYKFTVPFDCVIERAYLRFYGNSSTSDTIDIDFTPYSSTEAWLSVDPGTSDISIEDFNGTLIRLEKDNTYAFQMSSDGYFDSKNTWLEVHLRVDRFLLDGSETYVEYSPTMFNGGTDLDVATFDAEMDKIDATLDSIEAADVAGRVEFYVKHDFGTDDFNFFIPQADNTVYSHTGYAFETWTVDDDMPPNTQYYSTSIKNESGVSVEINTNAHSSTEVEDNTYDSTVSFDISGASGDLSDTTKDWYLDFNRAIGTETADKVYAWIWYK